MKALIFFKLFLFYCCIGLSQNRVVHERQDTTQVAILLKMFYALGDASKPDSSLALAENALALATKIHDTEGEWESLIALASHHRITANSPKALFYSFKGLRLAEAMRDTSKKARMLFQLARIYFLNLNDFLKAKTYLMQSFKAYEAIHDIEGLADIEAALSTIYRRTNQFDSMMIYQQRAYSKYESLGILDSNGRFMMQMGANYTAMGNYPLALSLLKKGVVVNRKTKIDFNVVNCLRDLAFVHEKMNRLDSTIYCEERSIEVAARNGFKQQLVAAYKHLADLYETKDKDIAHQYLKKAWAVNDSVNGPQKIIALETTISEEQERESQAEAESIAAQNRIKQYLFLGGLGILLLIAFLLYTNNRQKQKANQVLENTLTALKSTQGQLIQSEKLASLGELTAGIAHEIQNPLNFVNNFAEVSAEMLGEMKEEIVAGNTAEVIAIADDLEQNLSKINHHGQRASSIVKGMLEHSRASTGVKELTDLNALADEFLRLAYHGLRAKDNNFNATLETHFDPDLPLVSVIPQDIGRVLLNLINNAFYAVSERSRSTVQQRASVGVTSSHADTIYQPSVAVSTQKTADQIIISVQDNGPGIPESIHAKIFQPFFTTKPTGQGTGLGLSLAYDIVTKGHGGTINLQSKTGEGTTVSIWLPI